MFTSSKLFQHFASAYRNHKSTTDCYLLHGYCRDIYVEFGCNDLDKQGFVFDYGGLKDIKAWLEENFDHVTVLQADDPLVPAFRALEKEGQLKLTVVPTVSCEGWAMYIAKYIDKEIDQLTGGRAWVNFVEVRENSKNSSTYIQTYHSCTRTDDGLHEEYLTTDEITFGNMLDIADEMEGGIKLEK